MTLTIWASYSSFLFLYMLTPGPSHMLMMSNAMQSGFRRSIACAAGDLSANTMQILIVGLGISLAANSDNLLLTAKLIGITYLFYLGVQMLRRGKSAALKQEHVKSYVALYLQGLMASAINPKAIIFFSALMPQFIVSEAAIWPQLLVLGATYIVIDGGYLLAYGASADRVAKKLGQSSIILTYLPAMLMITTAVILSYRIVIFDLGL